MKYDFKSIYQDGLTIDPEEILCYSCQVDLECRREHKNYKNCETFNKLKQYLKKGGYEVE